MGLVENFTDLNCRECVIWREEGNWHYVGLVIATGLSPLEGPGDEWCIVKPFSGLHSSLALVARTQ